jgi:hypothetical protein
MAHLAYRAGEAGIAVACRSFGAMQLISNNASKSPEQIVKGAAPDQVFGWQLYVQADRRRSEAMLARINKLKAIKCVVLTLDVPVPGKRDDDERNGHIGTVTAAKNKKTLPDTSGPKADGLPLFAGTDPSLNWKDTPMAGQADRSCDCLEGFADARGCIPCLPPRPTGEGHHPLKSWWAGSRYRPSRCPHLAGDPEVLSRGF